MTAHPTRPRPACLSCHQRPPGPGAYLCGTCLGVLGDALDSVPAVLTELDTARTRLARLGSGQARRATAEHPLGYRPAAADATDRLTLTLASWTRHYATTLAAPDGPHSAPDGCAAWLAAHLDEIRARPCSAELVHEARAAVRVAWRAVDRPAARTYGGPCDECGAEITGTPGVATMACRGCGRVHDAAARRAYMLDALREHLATAAEIAGGLGELYGLVLNRKRINQWAHRGRLAAHATTPDARADPLFRVGDVLDIATAHVSATTPVTRQNRLANHPTVP